MSSGHLREGDGMAYIARRTRAIARLDPELEA